MRRVSHIEPPLRFATNELFKECWTCEGEWAVVSPSVRPSSEREHHATRHLHQINSPPDRDPFLELIGSSVAGAELGVDKIVQQKMTEDPRYV